ncbi:MAG: glycine cleavage T C-terminal barrel domain-containing protein [Pseudorhodobacter sp.]
MTPFAAGLGAFVDLDKEGFIGRTALLTADRGLRLFGLRCDEAVPDYRADVFLDGARVGHVSAATWSPTLNSGIGYVRFDALGDWLGQVVEVMTTSGSRAKATVVELPFLDKEKLIPRGVDRKIP